MSSEQEAKGERHMAMMKAETEHAGFEITQSKGGMRFMAQIPLEDILKRVPNIYEAVIVAAKEARRINDLKLMEQEQRVEPEEPVENDIGLEERVVTIEGTEEEKVTIQALKHLIEDKIQYSYESTKE